jgi:hypothetical protein
MNNRGYQALCSVCVCVCVCVAQAHDPPASASRSARLQVCHTTPGPGFSFFVEVLFLSVLAMEHNFSSFKLCKHDENFG